MSRILGLLLGLPVWGRGNMSYQSTITPTLGAELSGNIPLTVDDGWWTKGGNWTIGGGVATHTASAGNDALSRAGALTAGQWYRYQWDIVTRTAGFAWAGVGTPSGQNRLTPASYIDIGRTASTTLAFFGHTTFAGTIDNLSCKQITLASCFATQRQTASGDVIAEAAVTCLAGTQIGVGINMDSATNPQNMVSCYINGTSIFLDKRVAGTASTVLTAAITYVAGQKVKVVKSGTTYKIYYNDIQIGADQTIADAGVIGNTLHMQFSTYDGNNFGSFSVLPN